MIVVSGGLIALSLCAQIDSSKHFNLSLIFYLIAESLKKYL